MYLHTDLNVQNDELFYFSAVKHWVENRNTCTFQIYFSYYLMYNRRKIGRYFWFYLNFYGITQFLCQFITSFTVRVQQTMVLFSPVAVAVLLSTLFKLIRRYPCVSSSKYFRIFRNISICDALYDRTVFFLDSQHHSCWVMEGVKSVYLSTSIVMFCITIIFVLWYAFLTGLLHYIDFDTGTWLLKFAWSFNITFFKIILGLRL